MTKENQNTQSKPDGQALSGSGSDTVWKPMIAAPSTGSVSPERFLSDYADNHLYEPGSPKGMCDGCEHYRPADGMSNDEEDADWCWLKEGKYADGREGECPAWIASQNSVISLTPEEKQ